MVSVDAGEGAKTEVAVSRGGGGGGGETGGRGLKKGPWTAAEDGILIEYVKKHGEGNWNAVQKNTGLARCGKSCRLRWANHLRPNLKKGSFSPDEERIIIELHAKLGNKWARMAAQLPGRTDNEIKNYWNTRMKRRQRAGLPLYPLELQQEAAAFHLQNHPHHQIHHLHHQHPFQKNSHHSSSFSSLQPQKLHQNPSFSLFNPMNFSLTANCVKNQSDSSFYSTPTTQFKLLCENNGTTGFTLPLSPASQFVPSSSTMFSQSPPTQPLSRQPLQMNYGSYDCNSSLSSMIMGASFEQVLPALESELPSIQTPPHSATQASSGTSGGEVVMGALNSKNNSYEMATQSQGNSGLLDALLIEAQALSRSEKLKDDCCSAVVSEKGKQVMEDGMTEEEDADHVDSVVLRNSREATAENQSDDLSSSQSSTGMKTREEQIDEMDAMDDDLMSLLNNFPSAMPLPEWYPGGNNTYNDQSPSPSSYMTTSNPALDVPRNAASPARIASVNGSFTSS